MSNQNIYIIGHKSPDLDSVIGAISYSIFKNKLEKTDKYKAAVAGKLNNETKFVLEKFGLSSPIFLDNLENKKIIMVDHNEFLQAADKIEEAEILEVLDHHKINFKYPLPINFKTSTLGASCSMVYLEFINNNIEITKDLAAAMLSAILLDTVITKSPTCTKVDKEIIEELAKVSGINNWSEFGIELFKKRADFNNKSSRDIVLSDFKTFNFKQGRVGVGQVETVDLNDFKSLENDLLKSLDEIKKEENYHSTILFITDILKEGSLFLVASNNIENLNQAFLVKFENNKKYISGILSRKKQVAPVLEKIFNQ